MEAVLLYWDVVRDYESHLRHERNLTPRSLKTYHHWLKAFGEWADAERVSGDFSTRFTLVTLRRYQYHLSQAKKRPRTIHNAIGPLRSLGDWCVSMGLLTENPVRGLTMPRKDAANRPLASDSDLARLLEAADRQANRVAAARDRAILSVLVYCGVRYQELLDLRVQDVNLDAKTLLIASGKGRKPRLLYPNATCMSALAEWVRVREEVKPGYDWLWVCDVRRRMGENSVRTMLIDCKARAGLPPHAVVAPHAIRRAYATRCLKNGMDLRSLSASLGHSQASTTLIYTFDSERPAEAMRDHADLRVSAASPQSPAPSLASENAGSTAGKPRRADVVQRMRRRVQAGT